ncbi:MAG TPA: apolipoprotein N-acyltransferase, partial [Sulfurovum sp.]
MNKISQYFSSLELTKGFLIALLSSCFIYLNHWGFSYPIINTILGIMTLYLLLQEDQKVWFIAGTFIGLFWFWWIALSLKHYGYIWAIPAEILVISFIYGSLFWVFAWSAEKLSYRLSVPSVFFKSLFLLIFSYVHPFGFDW